MTSTAIRRLGPTLVSFVAACAASSLMLGISAGPALASEPATVVRVEIPVRSADIATPEGRAALDRRLIRASERACGMGEAGRDPAAHRRAKACRDAALADARRQVATLRLARATIDVTAF